MTVLNPIQSSQISKIYEQMSLAVEYEATRVWMLNVGDLKPYERSTEFFLTLGWNASRWTPDNLGTFVTSWAKRDFQVEDAEAENATSMWETRHGLRVDMLAAFAYVLGPVSGA